MRARGRVGGRRAAAGFTLLEMGFVIALLGVVAYMVADFHITQINLRNAERRADGVVQDVRSIIDASLAWAAADPRGRWPYNTLDSQIDIAELQDHGLLAQLPRNRYYECGADGCEDYELTGWDRHATNSDGDLGDYEDTYTNVLADLDANPEDLIVRFTVPGTHAYAIASRLPQGTVRPLRAAGADPDAEPEEYRVEARVLYGGSNRFVLLNNEGRAVVFARGRGSTPATGPLGDLRNVAAISGSADGTPPSISFTGTDVVVSGTLKATRLELGGCPVLCP